jgi:hypothetical protein
MAFAISIVFAVMVAIWISAYLCFVAKQSIHVLSSLKSRPAVDVLAVGAAGSIT